jgi:hypothetical protein
MFVLLGRATIYDREVWAAVGTASVRLVNRMARIHPVRQDGDRTMERWAGT